jgi:hypothetical protein
MTHRRSRLIAAVAFALAVNAALPAATLHANQSATRWMFDCASIMQTGGAHAGRGYPQDALGNPPTRFLNWHITLVDHTVPHRFRFVGNAEYTLKVWQSWNADNWEFFPLVSQHPQVQTDAQGRRHFVVDMENVGRRFRHFLVQAVPVNQHAPMGIIAYASAGPCPPRAPNVPTPPGGPSPVCPPGTRPQGSPLGQSTCVPIP